MNEWERAERMAKRCKEMYPVGTRIELIQMGDDPQPVPPGTRGTVAYVDDMGQIGMHWDNGRGLSLIPGEDSFRKLTEQEIADEQKAASFETVGPTLSAYQNCAGHLYWHVSSRLPDALRSLRCFQQVL